MRGNIYPDLTAEADAAANPRTRTAWAKTRTTVRGRGRKSGGHAQRRDELQSGELEDKLSDLTVESLMTQ